MFLPDHLPHPLPHPLPQPNFPQQFVQSNEYHAPLRDRLIQNRYSLRALAHELTRRGLSVSQRAGVPTVSTSTATAVTNSLAFVRGVPKTYVCLSVCI
jgi:hypothetical protein